MTDTHSNDVEARLARLERTVEELAASLQTLRATEPQVRRAAPSAPAAPPAAAPPVLAAPASEVPLSSLPRRSPARTDAEAFLGGRVMLAIGAITLLLGVTF